METARRHELLTDAKNYIKRSTEKEYNYMPTWAAAQIDAIDEAIAFASFDINAIFNARPPVMTSSIGFLPVNSTGLRQAVDEIDRLQKENKILRDIITNQCKY